MNPHTWGKGDHQRITTSDFPPAVLALVDERQGGRFCINCERRPPAVVLQVDHRRPLSQGGDNSAWNLQWACEPCNKGRGARREFPAVPRDLRGLRE